MEATVKTVKKAGVIFLACSGLLLISPEASAQSQKEMNMEKVNVLQLEVKGMHCQTGCANGLDRLLNEQQGIEQSKTSFDSSSSEVKYDKGKISEKEIIALIEERGFKVKVKNDD
jgi:copper chaperone